MNNTQDYRKYFIIFLTYAAGETNKNKLAELKSALHLVKASSDEEQDYGGDQIAKERTSTKHNIGHYWIHQLRNDVFRPMNLIKLTSKVIK